MPEKTQPRVEIDSHEDESAVSPEHAEPAAAAALDDQDMSAEQLAEAKRYGRSQLVCDLADKAVDLVYLGAMAFLFARSLDGWLLSYIANDWLRLTALFAIVILIHEAISLPLSYFAGHVLEVRHGLSPQSARRWFWRHFKQFGLAAGFGLAMFVGLYAIIWWTGPWWWLVAAAAFFVVSVVLGQLAPVLIMPLFYKIERLDSPELAERMNRLAEGTGLSIDGVYRIALSEETSKANAMLAGLGRTRRVLMGDTLLDGFTPDEIEVIFAHEIGHHVFGHLRKMLLAGVIYSAAGFWLCNELLMRWTAYVAGAPISPHDLPVYALPLLMFGLTVFGLFLEPVVNVISRRYERQCDRYALDRTGLRAAYRSAFRKLAKLNKDDPNPNPVAVFLFHSHPPIAERLSMADR